MSIGIVDIYLQEKFSYCETLQNFSTTFFCYDSLHTVIVILLWNQNTSKISMPSTLFEPLKKVSMNIKKVRKFKRIYSILHNF